MWLAVIRKIKRFLSRLGPRPNAGRIVDAFAKHLAADSSLILDEASLPYEKEIVLDAFASEVSALEAMIREMSSADLSGVMIESHKEKLNRLEVARLHLFEYQTVESTDSVHVDSIESVGGLAGIERRLKDSELPESEKAVLEGLRRTSLALTVKYLGKANREQEAYFGRAT